MQKCPLCNNTNCIEKSNKFMLCLNCYGIFKKNDFLLNKTSEKNHYDFHENNANDVNYQKFVSPITNFVLNDFTTIHKGLDFGCGRSSAIAKVLENNNYNIKQYDPYFKDNKALLLQKYDYITSCEVIEHFYEPKKEFELLKSILKTNGILYCMTHLYDENIDFEKWYYKNDPTHVFIYQEKTIEFIVKKFGFSSFCVENRLIKLFN